MALQRPPRRLCTVGSAVIGTVLIGAVLIAVTPSLVPAAAAQASGLTASAGPRLRWSVWISTTSHGTEPGMTVSGRIHAARCHRRGSASGGCGIESKHSVSAGWQLDKAGWAGVRMLGGASWVRSRVCSG